MGKILFLDDSQNRKELFLARHPQAICTTEAEEAIRHLAEREWEEVWLDHDLDGCSHVEEAEKNSGMEVVRWVLNNRPEVKKWIIHSMNEEVREKMVELLKAEARPFRQHFQDP